MRISAQTDDPDLASGAGQFPGDAGLPATGVVTGRRAIVSRKARETMRSAVPMGAG